MNRPAFEQLLTRVTTFVQTSLQGLAEMASSR
jgi:hypothetical protein